MRRSTCIHTRRIASFRASDATWIRVRSLLRNAAKIKFARTRDAGVRPNRSELVETGARVSTPAIKLAFDLDAKGKQATKPVSYTHLTLPTTPYV